MTQNWSTCTFGHINLVHVYGHLTAKCFGVHDERFNRAQLRSPCWIMKKNGWEPIAYILALISTHVCHELSSNCSADCNLSTLRQKANLKELASLATRGAILSMNIHLYFLVSLGSQIPRNVHHCQIGCIYIVLVSDVLWVFVSLKHAIMHTMHAPSSYFHSYDHCLQCIHWKGIVWLPLHLTHRCGIYTEFLWPNEWPVINSKRWMINI